MKPDIPELTVIPAHRHPHDHRRILAGLSLLALLTTTVGCGDDTEALADSVDVVATDYLFEELPDRIATDTVVTMRNDSDLEVHELVAYVLPDAIDDSAADIMARPEADLATIFTGPPALVIVAPPGENSFVAIGDGTLPEPGRYLLFCAIPTGADPAAYLAAAANSDGPPDIDGGPPHFVNGMAATIDVVEP